MSYQSFILKLAVAGNDDLCKYQKQSKADAKLDFYTVFIYMVDFHLFSIFVIFSELDC